MWQADAGFLEIKLTFVALATIRLITSWSVIAIFSLLLVGGRSCFWHLGCAGCAVWFSLLILARAKNGLNPQGNSAWEKNEQTNIKQQQFWSLQIPIRDVSSLIRRKHIIGSEWCSKIHVVLFDIRGNQIQLIALFNFHQIITVLNSNSQYFHTLLLPTWKLVHI
jgi:hypothetical protein